MTFCVRRNLVFHIVGKSYLWALPVFVCMHVCMHMCMKYINIRKNSFQRRMDDKRYIFENIFWEETIGVVSETMDQISTRLCSSSLLWRI